MDAILTRNLRRRFNGREVLKGIDLEVGYGMIVTLLGPNGAGKTTLIRILTTELMPHSGEAYVAGFDVVKQASEVRRRIAVVPQDARPITYMTPYEFVYAYLLLRGLSRGDAKSAAKDTLEELGLWELRRTPIYQLSGGMARRVLVAAVLASNAEIVFLDEPTVGLDVASRRVVWNSLKQYSDGGATVFLTTHYIDEAEQISNIVLLMDSGKVVAWGRPRDLVESLPGKYVVEYPISMNNGSCIKIGPSCISFVNSLNEVSEGALRVSPKSLEHYVLVTIRSWGEGNEEG
ncbi:MAG: ABC transporter ATP-binding protein [Vulcanisaeta sp. AZ3]